MREIAQDMLDAHARFELARWQGEPLRGRLRAFVGDLFRWLAEVKLEDVSSQQHVMGVIDRYVIALRVSGGLVELSGEFSQLVFTSQASAETSLAELVDDEAYQGFTQKISQLEGVRRELIALIARSEAAQLAQARLITRAVRDLLPETVFKSTRVRSALLAIEARVARALAEQLEQRRERTGAQRERRLLELIDLELVRSMVDEVWTSVSAQPLGQLFRLITQQDLEDFVALGAEFWLRYRKSSYYRRVTKEVVEHFFRKYGPQSLLALLEDVGVTEDMVLRELVELLQPVLREAARSAFLMQQIRVHLSPFYASPECAALLSRS